MGHIFDHTDAERYEAWVENRKDRFSATMESRLLFELLRPARTESLLDIGCGSGHLLSLSLTHGLDSTGIDPSEPMLERAAERLGNRADLYRGVAEDLPFGDNSFNHATLFSTLEFVENPEKAMEEAFRVAKDRVVIGFHNRWAIKGFQRRIQAFFGPTPFSNARFYSVWEVKEMARELAGDVPISWKSICLMPEPESAFSKSVERSLIAQKMPFGTFVCMCVTLKPTFRVKPLALRYRAPNGATPSLGGLAADSGNGS